MIFTDANLERLGVHYTGNKQNGGGLLLSKQEQRLNEELKARLREALLQRFTNCHERYSFTHASSLEFNEVYSFARTLFADRVNFYEQSVNIARHLFESSLHPKIKPGELYVAIFNSILDDEDAVEAIGLFKAETKSLFADLVPGDDDLDLQLKEGVELARMDKGCLILNRGEEKGFELLIYDSNGKGEEAQYWKDKFLGVLIQQNEFLRTQEFLTLTKNYVTQQMPDEFEVSKTEQIDILNRSMDYFKTHGNFDRQEFESEVLHHDDLIRSFRNFDEQHRRDNDLETVGEFGISPQAVKRQARVFKSVIKLDKNFHIYVHGNRELIEKGYDEVLQKHYYKIYFDQEA
ncbi:MAG TPA: nucleoid-associated protein [Puia sp.]|nr:nucleoid-associated protein [Puia sp.]